MSDYARIPTATVKLDGQRWRAILSLSYSQRFGENIAGGGVVGRDPPVKPHVGMDISWMWGYNGVEVAGCTGQVSHVNNASYPNRASVQVKDVLWRADKSNQVLATDPLNEITAQDAVIYLLHHFGGVPSSRLAIPTLSASGAAWGGSEWVLGILTPVQWGDSDTDSGGTTALKAAAEICSALGYWLYADAGGIVRAKQMERRPSTSARETFQRGVNLLLQGAPERQEDYDSIFNQVTVRGANTGVDGAQLLDQRRTTSPLLDDGVYRDFPFSSFLLEYENESDAGVASVTGVSKRIITVVSRVPDVETHRAKADPNRKVGDTAALIDPMVGLTSAKNYFIYAIDRTLDLQKGAFDDQLTLDGGIGSTGFTTIPPPDASFSWLLDAETLDGTAVVVVALDGSGSTSPSGEIVSYAWSTDATPYGGTASSATGVHALLVFTAADSPVNVTLTVTDTTSKTGSFTAAIDLTGADTRPPIRRILSVAFGAAWTITPDGGATTASETTNGDAVAVAPYGAGIDARAAGTSATYGLLATRGSGGAGGLRQTLDALSTASTNLASASGAIACIWANEANPARVWWAIGDTIYRSLDGGATGTAMAKPNAGTDVSWIIEDPAVDNSVFAACGADLYNTTNPVSGWAVLYPGPPGATARQFVRSRDGQVTWIGYLDAPSGQAAQRIETGALADIAVTDIRTLALDRNASSLAATLTLIGADDPAAIYHVDGLTGLSAVTSAATFPAGATAMHMLPDPDFDIYYTADFDSVVSGTGAVRKLIADQLLLMLAGDTGQQAHMLGFGGPPRTAARILLGTTGTATDGGGIWYYNGAWTLTKPGPTSWRWLWVSANPFNALEWLALGNSGSGTATKFSVDGAGKIIANGTSASPLWHTADAGATWSPITLIHPVVTSVDGSGVTSAAIASRCSWQTAQSGWLFSIRSDDGITGYDRRTSWWRGSGTTITDGPHTNALIGGFGWQADAHAPGRDNDLILMKTFQGHGQFYVAGDATVETLIGTSFDAIPYPVDYEAGALASNLAVAGDDGHLWYSANYRTTLIADTGLTGPTSVTGVASGWVAVHSVGLYFSSLTPTTATIIPGTEADVCKQVRADRQTHTVVAARTDSTVVMYDTAALALTRVLLPVVASELSVTAIEPIVGGA